MRPLMCWPVHVRIGDEHVASLTVVALLVTVVARRVVEHSSVMLLSADRRAKLVPGSELRAAVPSALRHRSPRTAHALNPVPPERSPSGGAKVAKDVLRSTVAPAIVVVVTQMPPLSRSDPVPAPPAIRQARIDDRGQTFPVHLMDPAISTSIGLPNPRHVKILRNRSFSL